MNFDKSLCSQIKGWYFHSHFFDPPNAEEMHGIVMNLKNSDQGHDGIRNSLIKEIIDYIVNSLTHIFSLSLQYGIVLKGLKIAKVIPIYKSGGTKDFSSYCQVSILHCFSNILEKLIYTRISAHLAVDNTLYNHQYGFGNKYFTEHAPLQLVNNILQH